MKMPKRCEKRLYKHIKVVLCKKRLEKKANIRKMRAFSKLQEMATMQAFSPCKILSFGQKLNMPKRCEKRLCNHFKVALCKKRLEKTTYNRN